MNVSVRAFGVRFDRLGRDLQFLRDLFVRKTAPDQSQDIRFPGAQEPFKPGGLLWSFLAGIVIDRFHCAAHLIEKGQLMISRSDHGADPVTIS